MSLSPRLNTRRSKSPADHKAIWPTGPNHEIQMPFPTTRANCGTPIGVTPLVAVFPGRRGSAPSPNCRKTRQLHPWHDTFRKTWVTLRCPGGRLCYKLLLPCWDNSWSEFSPDLIFSPYIFLIFLMFFAVREASSPLTSAVSSPVSKTGWKLGAGRFGTAKPGAQGGIIMRLLHVGLDVQLS